jgi:hypothetical protein
MRFNNNEQSQCPTCDEPVYSNDKPRRTINMLPLSTQLGLLLFNTETRKDLLYRANYTHNENFYDSIFSGSHYQAQKHQLFESPYDIAIGLYVDGFKPPAKPSTSLTMVHIVIYNYHPSIR